MSPGVLLDTLAAPRFPRVSGDEPEYQELGTLLGAFSPRERG